jgi:hypothetical protein
MNMMDMAVMEEAIDASWERRGALKACLRISVQSIYGDGFRAGVAWAARQAQSQASPPAVGTISQYRGEAEEPEEEA